MRWLFAIIPLNDFNREYGPLLVSPDSHKLAQVIDPDAHILDLTRPDPEQLPDFVDPELKAGDLLLMDMHTWHKAPGGTTSDDRVGIFNKYCAVNAPPAAGYYPYDRTAYDALSDAGKRLIPLHFDQPLTDTRLLIESTSGSESRYFLTRYRRQWKLGTARRRRLGRRKSRLGHRRSNRVLAVARQESVERRYPLGILYRRRRNQWRSLAALRVCRRRSGLRITRRWRLVHTRPAPEHARRVTRHLPRCLNLAQRGPNSGPGQGGQPEPTAIRIGRSYLPQRYQRWTARGQIQSRATLSAPILPQQHHAASDGEGRAFQAVDIDPAGRLLAIPILTVPSQYMRPSRKMAISQHAHDLTS